MELFGVFAGVAGAFRANTLKSAFGCRRVFALFFKCFSSPGPPGAGAGGILIDFLDPAPFLHCFFSVFRPRSAPGAGAGGNWIDFSDLGFKSA